MPAETVFDHRLGECLPLPGGVTNEDLSGFLGWARLSFHAFGHSQDWKSTDAFTACASGLCPQGESVPWARVQEWARASASIGARITDGGLYRHYQGQQVTTLGEAFSEDDLSTQVIFKREDGSLGTCNIRTFFEVIDNGGALVARFTHQPDF